MLRPVFSILFLLIVLASLAGVTPKYSNKKLTQENFILILNSYCYENSWGAALTKQLQEEIELINPELISRVAYARLDMQKSFLGSRLQMQSSFTKGRLSPKVIRPRILVLIGEESWMLYRIMNLRGLWEKIPVVLCGVHPRILKDYADFFKPEAPLDSCYLPTATSIKQLPVTGILKDDVSLQNLQLMHYIYPDFQEIAYISTGGYSDCFELQQLSTAVSQFYPHLQISVYHDQHPDSICAKLNSLSSRHVVAVYNTSPAFLPALKIPVFSLQDQAFESERILGGFYASTKQYAKQTAEFVRRLYEGERAEQLPFVYVQEKHNYLNQQLLDELGVLENVGKVQEPKMYCIPPSFIKRHQRFLLWGLLGVLIVGLLYRYYIRNQLYNRQIRESWRNYKSLYNEYRLIFDHMPVSMLIFDENGFLIQHSSSPGLQRIFPILTDSAALDSLRINLFDHISSTSLCTKIRNQEMINIPIVLYPPVPSGMNSIQKNKCYFRFLVRYITGDTVDRKQILVVLIDNQEIYEQKNIRRKLMQALDYGMDKVAIGVANYSLGGQKFYLTSNWLKNLGLNEKPAKITQAYQRLSSEDRQSIVDFLQDTRPERPLHFDQELSVMHQDGSKHWLRYQIGITGFQQEVNSLVFTEISQNIDQAKAMEEELYNAMLKAQRSEKLKNAFIANMGHEIRTPLNVIVGFSNLLCETNDFETRQEMVRQIEENNEILLRLIHDIIDLSKIEAESMDFTFSSTDLADLFNDMAIIAKMKTPRGNIEIICEFPEEHYCIRTDKVRLKQVLTNFIGNAVKFTSQGKITLGYLLRDHELYGYVKDTGIGITKEKQKQIFERFFRGNKNYKGFGLGLSISRSIIEGLNGKIGVESEVGQGSEFWFRLPVGEVVLTTEVEQNNAVVQENQVQIKHHILVVEDNESNFLLLQFILKDNYNLIHAWNGEEAIELFHLHTPDLILMDIKMPKMNGYEATQEIRKYSATIPIIATTAYALSKDEEEVLYHGFDGYLAKPLQKQVLLDTIHDWLVR